MTQPFLTQLSHRAMATEFVVLLASPDSDAIDEALEALEMLDQIEAALSVYRPDSEVSLVNRHAADRPVVVSAETFDLIQRAVLWSERTDGAFDITAGPLVQAWGFGQRRGQKPSSELIREALARVGWRHLLLDSGNRTIQFGLPGMSINLGAIGKGDALDRLTQRLRARGVTDFLIHGGNSSVVAMGDQQPQSGGGWSVGIAHPSKPSRRIAGVRLRDQSLATSGSGKQFFHHQGQRYGHVIDPRTGQPAGDLLSLTVIGSTAAGTDACATGWFVAGSAWVAQEFVAQEFAKSCDPSDDIAASILVSHGKRQDEVVITSFGTPLWVDGDEPRPPT